MTRKQLNNFADFIRDYSNNELDDHDMKHLYGFSCDDLNYYEAIDKYIEHNKLKLEDV